MARIYRYPDGSESVYLEVGDRVVVAGCFRPDWLVKPGEMAFVWRADPFRKGRSRSPTDYVEIRTDTMQDEGFGVSRVASRELVLVRDESPVQYLSGPAYDQT